MFNLRQYPYLYVTDASDEGRSQQTPAVFPRYDLAAAAYEPAFVDCSSLFVDRQHQRSLQSAQDGDVAQLQDSSTTPHFQKDTWTVTEYQSLASQLNYSSQ